MQSFKFHCNPTAVTYESYCKTLDSIVTLNEAWSIPTELIAFVKQVTSMIVRLGGEIDMAGEALVTALKERDAYLLLKAVGFSLKALYHMFTLVINVEKLGMLSLSRALLRTTILQDLRSGAMKVDDFLKAHPELKQITGMMLAGCLLCMWFFHSHTGVFEHDFNIAHIADAAAGKFTIRDLLLSAEGILFFTLFASGVGIGISFPWMVEGESAFTLALVYTLVSNCRKKDTEANKLLTFLRSHIKFA
jgi:hypothetical protein